jgi:hypothetical protein
MLTVPGSMRLLGRGSRVGICGWIHACARGSLRDGVHHRGVVGVCRLTSCIVCMNSQSTLDSYLKAPFLAQASQVGRAIRFTQGYGLASSQKPFLPKTRAACRLQPLPVCLNSPVPTYHSCFKTVVISRPSLLTPTSKSRQVLATLYITITLPPTLLRQGHPSHIQKSLDDIRKQSFIGARPGRFLLVAAAALFFAHGCYCLLAAGVLLPLARPLLLDLPCSTSLAQPLLLDLSR